MDYYSSIKNNKIMPLATTCMDLETVFLKATMRYHLIAIRMATILKQSKTKRKITSIDVFARMWRNKNHCIPLVRM